MAKHLLRRLALLPSSLLLLAVSGLALLFAPLRIGRMLRTVSIPRMREHGLRTTFTVLGVALGVAVLVAVILVSRSIESGVTATVDDLAGKADLQVGAGTSGFDESVLDRARTVAGVHKMTPVVQQRVTLHTKAGGRERLLVFGVDLLGDDDSYFRSYASTEIDEIRKEPLAFLNSAHNIILGRELADRLGVKLHDKIELATSNGREEFDVWGFIETRGVGRAFGGAIGIMYYPALQVAFGRDRNIDRIDIAVARGVDTAVVEKRLAAVLGTSFQIERPASRGDRVAQMLTAVRTALSMSSVLALVAGGFLVISTMGISVVQRKREIGILRALGATRRQVVSLLTLEGFLMGTVGSTLGVLLAMLLSRSLLAFFGDAVSSVYVEQAARDVAIDPRVLALGFSLGIIAATLAAWIATSKAGGIRPTEALSANTLEVLGESRPSRRADLLGLGLLVATVLLLRVPPIGPMPYGAILATFTLTVAGRVLMPRLIMLAHRALQPLRKRVLGVAGNLAADNLPRDLARTASMASGLMAGVSLTVGVGTFIVSFITSLNTWSAQLLPGELVVTSGSATGGLSARNTPLAHSLGEVLDEVPGVAHFRTTRFQDFDFRGFPVQMVASENRHPRYHSHFRTIEGSEADVLGGYARGDVVVSENFARRFAVHQGDRIALPTKHGTRDFAVAAVLVDYTSDRGVVSIDREHYVEHFGDTRVDSFELFLEPGADRERVRQTINQQLAEKYDLFVLTNAEFRGEFVKAADKVFSLMSLLEIVTLIVAMLGMVTAVLANVLDRVRELGVLRALGMLRAQVQRMVVTEATLIGSMGALGGILTGLGVGYILLRHIAGAQMGWHLPYSFPLAAILSMLAVALPISALSGLYPARKAAHLSVRDALDYE